MRAWKCLFVSLLLAGAAQAQECFDYGPGGDPAGPPRTTLGTPAMHSRSLYVDGRIFLGIVPDWSDPHAWPAGALYIYETDQLQDRQYVVSGELGEFFYEYVVRGDYVYTPDGNAQGMHVYNWRTAAAYDVVIGAFPLAVAGDVVYARTGAGVTVFGLADPAHPAAGGTFLEAADVKQACVSGSTAVFLSQDHLYVADVSTPAAPVLVGSCAIPASMSVQTPPVISGSLCLTGHDSAVTVYDIGDPAAPVQLGRLAMPGGVKGLAVAGTCAYAAQDDYAVIDLANPAVPTILGTIAADDNGVDVQVVDTALLVNGNIWTQLVPLQCGSIVPVLVPGITTTWRDGVCHISWEQTDALAMVRLQATSGGRTWTVPWQRNGRTFAADDATWVGAPGDEVVYAVQVSSGTGWTTVAEVQTRIPSFALVLSDPTPNPFNPATELSFTLDRAGTADLAVFDLSGHKVRTLASGTFGAGPHAVTWQGRDDAGRAMPAGVYFARLVTAGGVRSVKLMLVK